MTDERTLALLGAVAAGLVYRRLEDHQDYVYTPAESYVVTGEMAELRGLLVDFDPVDNVWRLNEFGRRRLGEAAATAVPR